MTHEMVELANWLEHDRGLDSGAITRHGLSARQTRDGLQVGLSYRQHGQVKYTKWRPLTKAAGPMSIEPSGSEMQLYNIELFDDIEGDIDTLVITEGELDCIACTEAGFHAVSVPNGGRKPETPHEVNPLEDTGYKYLWRGSDYIPQLKRVKTFILATDMDENGDGLAQGLSGRLGPHKCKRVRFPDGCKDANEVLQKGYGINVLRQCILEAEDLVDDGLEYLAEIDDEQDSSLYPVSVIPEHMFRFTFPELMVVAGNYGAGKSSWVAWFTCEMARLHGVTTTFLRLEEKRKHLRPNYVNYAVSHGIDPYEFQRKFVTLKDSSSLPSECLDLAWVESKMEVSARKFGSRLFVIDPWNELEHNFKFGQSETNYTAEALTRLKRKAGSLNMSLVIAAHFGKAATEKAVDDITASDVSGSQNWGNKADHAVLLMTQDIDKRTVWLKVEKSKYHAEMGKPGKILLQYDPLGMVYKKADRVFSAQA